MYLVLGNFVTAVDSLGQVIGHCSSIRLHV